MWKKIIPGILVFMTSPVYAAVVDIRQGGRDLGPFEQMAEWLSKYANFMQGPFAMALILGSMILAACVWVFSPKEGALGLLARAVAAGFVVLNAGTWLASFTS